jgi:hypothetical protein
MKFISIGPYCKTAQILIEHKLRTQAYPFDYIFSSLEMIQHCLNDRFDIFLNRKLYIPGNDNKSTKHVFYCKFLDTDILYRHHLRHNYDVDYIVSSGN